jgi:hypothetical protein
VPPPHTERPPPFPGGRQPRHRRHDISPRKISAAEAKRQRAKLTAERTAPPTPLPAEFIDWLRISYHPQDSSLRALWATPLLPFTEQTLLLSQIRGEEALRKHVTHLALYGAWRHQRGLPLDPRPAMNRREVDEYTRTGMPGSSEKSRSDRRSRLRVICDHLNPEQAPHAGVVIPREAIKPPYRAGEMQALIRAIQVQPTEELVRRLCLCVGLGAGAGIDSPDLKLLDTNHATDHGEDGIRIQVPGVHAREVWLLRDYEHLVRRGLQGLRPGQPLIGRVKTRRNVAADVYADAVLLGSLPKLEQSRLRTTWLATVMSRPVPLAVILTAAGLKSTRTLFDLLPHLDSGPPTGAVALRDGGAK